MSDSKPLVGIVRETKNRWERRAPLTPDHVRELGREHGLRFRVQPSTLRVFPDIEYADAGGELNEDLSVCNVVMGVKEMPIDSFRQDGTYVFFSHVIKGQSYNMPMLARMMELGCNLVDYERIVDEQERRLVFFGRHAGIAGAVDTLQALGQRLVWEGYRTALADVQPTHKYEHIDTVMDAMRRVGHRLRREGLPSGLVPLVIGVAGYGHVAQGALEVLDSLGAVDIAPEQLPDLFSRSAPGPLCRTVFREEHMVDPREPGRSFDLQEYYDHPELYRASFEERLPYLTALVNCIYWTDRYPRLVTNEWLRGELGKPDGLKLRVVGDISCDVGGAVEATARVTDPGEPAFVFDPEQDSTTAGVEGRGVVIMAVDNLPCELPADSSEDFGRALMPFVPALAAADFGLETARLELPVTVRRALVLHQGNLTSDYEYLTQCLKNEGAL